jgi:hypothetical protein
MRMEKFKNFLYDKNDIIVALVIIILATFIITGRINAIMVYPETMLQKAQEEAGSSVLEPAPSSDEAAPVVPVASDPLAEAPIETAPDTTVPNPAAPIDNPPPANDTVITLIIPAGSSGDAIANLLIGNGLIAQKSDFLSAVAAAGVEKKLKAGTFKIPAGSTPAQVVAIITK